MKCYGIMPERKLWVKIGIIILGLTKMKIFITMG